MGGEPRNIGKKVVEKYKLGGDIVDCILAIYGTENGEFLSALIHSENPWKITRGNILSETSSEDFISN